MFPYVVAAEKIEYGRALHSRDKRDCFRRCWEHPCCRPRIFVQITFQGHVWDLFHPKGGDWAIIQVPIHTYNPSILMVDEHFVDGHNTRIFNYAKCFLCERGHSSSCRNVDTIWCNSLQRPGGLRLQQVAKHCLLQSTTVCQASSANRSIRC